MYYFQTKTLMIYVNHPVYDFHDVPNALFLNNNIDDYSFNFHFCVRFLIPAIINTRCLKKHFLWIIINKIYIFSNYKLIFLTLFKYLIILLHIFDMFHMFYVLFFVFYIFLCSTCFQYVLCGSIIS